MKRLKQVLEAILENDEKSTVDGPYKSQFTDKNHYIIVTPKGQYAVVADGQQPNEGILHPNLRSAKAHLKDNGFEKV